MIAGNDPGNSLDRRTPLLRLFVMSYDGFTRLLYVVAAVLEAGGVLGVLWDVRRDRDRAREYLGQPRRVRIPWRPPPSVQ